MVPMVYYHLRSRYLRNAAQHRPALKQTVFFSNIFCW